MLLLMLLLVVVSRPVVIAGPPNPPAGGRGEGTKPDAVASAHERHASPVLLLIEDMAVYRVVGSSLVGTAHDT